MGMTLPFSAGDTAKALREVRRVLANLDALEHVQDALPDAPDLFGEICQERLAVLAACRRFVLAAEEGGYD